MLTTYLRKGYSFFAISLLLVFTSLDLQSQCTSGYTSGSLTVSSPCAISSNITISGDLILEANLTISSGVVVTVSGAVTNNYTGTARTISVSGGRINSATLNPGQNTTLALNGTTITTTGQCSPQYHSGLTLTNSTLNIGTSFSDGIQQNSVTLNNSTLTTGTNFTLSGNTGLSLTNGSSMTIGGTMQLNGGTGKQFGVCATCTVNADALTSGGILTMNWDGDINVTNAISLTNGSQVLNINGTVDAGSISHSNGKTVNIGVAGRYATTGAMTASGGHNWTINGDFLVGSFSGPSASTVNINSTGTFNSTGSISTSAGFTWNVNGDLSSTSFSSSAASNYNVASTGSWTSTALNFTSGTQQITNSGAINTGPLETSGSSGFTLNPTNGSFHVAGNITVGGGNFTINGGNGDITTTGALSVNNGSFSLYDTLSVPGNIVANSGNNIQIYPYGRLIAEQNLTINSNESLIVGTNVAPPPYADLVIQGDLNSNSSGDITVNQNGRVAVYGDVNDDGSGGTFLQLQNGAQMYVDGDINFTGGGNSVINNNSTDPYGLYVNGTINQSGGGSSTTSNVGDRDDLSGSNSDFNSWVGGQPNSPLPVELLYFKGSFSNGESQLTWKTASELNNDFFTLERSIDGVAFQKVGEIKGVGTTTKETVYNYSDKSSMAGIVYYRLSQTDFDGTSEHLGVVALKSELSEVSIYPNPVKQGEPISILNFADDSDFRLVDLSGKVVQAGKTQGNKATITGVESGVYFLKLTGQGLSFATRIVVQ